MQISARSDALYVMTFLKR